MASVSRLDTLIRRCLYTGFFLLPLVFNAWTFEKFELTKILLFYGMVLIAGLLVSVKLLADGELRIPKNRLFAVVVSLGIIFFLSSVVSVHPQTSFLGYYLRFNGSFLHYAALICMLLVLDNCRSNSLYERLFRLSVAAGVLTSIYGIVQWFGWDFKTFNIVGIRALSTFGEPTNLAGFLAIILPFTLMYVMIARSRREKIVYSASTVAVYFCLLLTYSRGAYLAAGCAVCILFVALFINRRQINLREISPYLGLITIACVLVTVYVFTVPRTITSAFQNRETSTLSIRLEVWKTVPVLVAERPLLGS
ncbi:MAG TPA: O-antigen ligase family protein, partial [bacterium]|nr:O-antigen ligase family protein [bacterium]